MSKRNKYSIQVAWSQEDKEFVAICPELQYLSFLHKKKIKAVKGLEGVIDECIEWSQDKSDPGRPTLNSPRCVQFNTEPIVTSTSGYMHIDASEANKPQVKPLKWEQGKRGLFAKCCFGVFTAIRNGEVYDLELGAPIADVELYICASEHECKTQAQEYYNGLVNYLLI